jgi:hypothetical protein
VLVPLKTSGRVKMTHITQIDDRVAALAWSPIASVADVIVVGTKVRVKDAIRYVTGSSGHWELGVTLIEVIQEP